MSQDSSEHPLPESSQHLRSLLKQRGWSQNELSKRSNIDKGTVSRLVNGRSLTHENVQRLAGAFELSPQALLQEGPWPSAAATHEVPCDETHEVPCDETHELVGVAQWEQPRAPDVKKTLRADRVSQAEQIAQLKARITKLERDLKLLDNHCSRTEDQNRDFCRQLFAYEQDIAALTIQRDQAIAERDQAQACLRAVQQQTQEDQVTSRVADMAFAALGGAATGAGVTGVQCKKKMDRLEKENNYWKAHAAFLQRELEEQRRCSGALAQQGAQPPAPAPSEPSASLASQGGEPTEPKPLALKPFQLDVSDFQRQLAQILAASSLPVKGASAPSEGGG
jgi:transcriptional regulator with XRE-family HTH domain